MATPKVLGRILLIPKGDYNSSTTYNSLDWVTYNHKSWVCKVDGTSGIAPEEGANWQMIAKDGRSIDRIEETTTGTQHHYTIYYTEPLPDGSTTFEFNIYDGTGGGGGGGDMYKNEYAKKGIQGVVDKADVANTATSATTATNATNALNLKKSDGTTVPVDEITTKLSALDNGTTDIGNVLTADGNNTFSWKKAKGGHDILTYDTDEGETVDDGIQRVLTNTLKENVVDARIVKEFANTYKERIKVTTTTKGITIGNWDDTTNYTDWISDSSLIVADNDEDVELQFMFEVDGGVPIYLGGYRWENSLGKLCVKFGAEVEANTVIAVDIIHTRRV